MQVQGEAAPDPNFRHGGDLFLVGTPEQEQTPRENHAVQSALVVLDCAQTPEGSAKFNVGHLPLIIDPTGAISCAVAGRSSTPP